MKNLDGHFTQGSRVLVWSLRNVQNYVYNACLFEFEDVVDTVDDTDILSPQQYSPIGKAVKRAVINKTKRFKALSLTSVNPYGSSIELAYEYDIYFVILDFPWSLSSLNLLKNWRRKCRYVICYVVEIWNSDIPQLVNFLEFFKDFDLVCIGTYCSLEAVQKAVSQPCVFLPPGIDMLKFAPATVEEDRAVDVCNLGRRSSVTHKALLALAERESFFYYHELTNGSSLRIDNHQSHRTLLANLLKNSRYCITNYAKADKPELIDGECEIGYRFFEGVATGNVLIGAPPRGDLFDKYFDWEDAIIPAQFDEPNIADIIHELDDQPNYLKRIRTQNIVNSLRKHDWVYRWEQILQHVGLSPTRALIDRKAQLLALADKLEGSADCYSHTAEQQMLAVASKD